MRRSPTSAVQVKVFGAATSPLCLFLLFVARAVVSTADGAGAPAVQQAYDQARAVLDDPMPEGSSATPPKANPGEAQVDQSIPPDTPAPIYRELSDMRARISSYFIARGLLTDQRQFKVLSDSYSGLQTLREKQFFRNVCARYGIDPC